MTDPKPMTVGERVLWNSRKAASYLGIARSTLAAYEHDGLIQCVRFPGQRKAQYRKEALDDFIARSEAEAAGHIAGHNKEVHPSQTVAIVDIKRRVQKPRKTGNLQWRHGLAAK